MTHATKNVWRNVSGVMQNISGRDYGSQINGEAITVYGPNVRCWRFLDFVTLAISLT